VSLNTAVSYTLTFTPVNYVQGMTLKVTLPSDLVIADGTFTCTNLRGLSDATFSCVYSASTREIVVSNQFRGAVSPGEVSLQMPSITNPTTYRTTNSFAINTYHTVGANTYAIDSKNTGLTAEVRCATK
jgi:hypothetical protein